MYKAQSSAPNGAAGQLLGPLAAPAAEAEKPKDNVVDAEFVDVEDKK